MSVRELLEDADENTAQVLMARQPIFTKNQDIAAFSLLFRHSDGAPITALPGGEATATVLLNSYTSVCQHGIVQQLPCFLKITDQVLLADTLPQLPPQQFTLELICERGVSEALLARIDDLISQGYRFALGNFDPNAAQLKPLLERVHIVKLDLLRLGMTELPEVARQLRSYHIELLADKVETREQFRDCLELGFNYFQGYFLSKPETLTGRQVSTNKTVLLQLLAELNNPEASAASLEQIALKDPTLTYKLLKVVNSAAFRVPKEIESLSHAITLLGLEQIRRWVLLFLTTPDNGEPVPLTQNMLVRGRMCELMAELLGRPQPLNYFITGVLSQLDALLGIEMQALLEQVPLPGAIKEAILEHKHDMGLLLREAEHYEKGEFEQLHRLLENHFYEVAYRHSLKWAQQVIASMTATSPR